VLVTIPEIWSPFEPLPDEPVKAHEAFAAWLSDGCPAIRTWAEGNAQAFGVSTSGVQHWAMRWRWRARADAIRFEVTRTAAASALEKIRDYGERMGEAWIAAFEAASRTVLDAGATGDLQIKDAIALMKHATEVLNALRAQAPAPRANLAALSDSELAALEAMSTKALPPGEK